jgi:hypothetical protein
MVPKTIATIAPKKTNSTYRPQKSGKQEARLLRMSQCIFVVRHG